MGIMIVEKADRPEQTLFEEKNRKTIENEGLREKKKKTQEQQNKSTQKPTNQAGKKKKIKTQVVPLWVKMGITSVLSIPHFRTHVLKGIKVNIENTWGLARDV